MLLKRTKRTLSQQAIAEKIHYYAPIMESNKTDEDSKHGICEHQKSNDFVGR
jgi:hypothetical protein